MDQVNLNQFDVLLKYHGIPNKQVWHKVLILNINHMHNHREIGMHLCLGNHDHLNLEIHLGHKVGKFLTVETPSVLNLENHILHTNLNTTLLNLVNHKFNHNHQINHFHYHPLNFLRNPINYLLNHF